MSVEICESDPRCRGLSLNAFLIKPIQRICKYPLLFRVHIIFQFRLLLIKFTSKEVLKHTSPEEQARYQVLMKALKKIEEVTGYINEGKRVAEKLQRIVEIQESIDSDLV